MKIVFTIASLDVGGAQHVLITLCQEFLQRKHDLTVITTSGCEDDFYALPEGVQRIALDVNRDSPTVFHALYHNLKRIRKVRQAVLGVRPDLIISQMVATNITTLLASKGTNIPVIAIEHVDPPTLRCKKIWQILARMVYPMADYLVTASKGVAEYFNWMPLQKRTVIYNPVVDLKTGAHSETIFFKNSSRPKVMGMGRLVEQKGFHLLIQAFAGLADDHPDWDLYIVGEGEKRIELEAQIKDLGLQDRIYLPGTCHNAYAIIAASELFVLSSIFEGLPSVLIGAMACGVPVISFDCRSGPREIIRDGIDGILVSSENVELLKAAMNRLMSDKAERLRLSKRSVEVIERFNLTKIADQWEALFKTVIKKPKSIVGREIGSP